MNGDAGGGEGMGDGGEGMRDVLADRVAATPDRLALLDAASGETWSYADLDAAVDELAGRLASASITAGDRVPLLLETSVDAVRAVHALLCVGATPVPLDVTLTSGELRRRVGMVDADHLVCVADTVPAAIDATGERSVEPIALGNADRVPSVRSHDTIGVPGAERGPDEPAVIMFTSGTTGAAKAVVLTGRNLRASAVASAFRLGVRPGDRWLCPLPVYHMGGLAPVLRSALYGTAVVIQEGFDAERTARATREHDATGISLVPTALHRIFEAGARLAPSLRFVLLGGAAASDSLIDVCERRGVPVHPTYGTTETASQIATATPTEAFEHRGTVGQPLLGTEVRIVDEAGTERPAGETGEIVVAGPTVTPGYLDGDGSIIGSRGLRTGDLGYRDEAGRLYVVGRVDDVIVTGGENVPAGEVEATLRDHPDVGDAAVVGLDDPEWGERVAALVVPAGDPESEHAVSADELHAFCRGRLAGFKTPKTIRVTDVLPRTPSGTVDREAVRDRLRE
ncbi:MAG: class I adenylate-forming enzyme family protein [Halobacteriales archaeon]